MIEKEARDARRPGLFLFTNHFFNGTSINPPRWHEYR
jgi:hypothetical protein